MSIKTMLAAWMLLVPLSAAAQQCLIWPSTSDRVNSRFGVMRRAGDTAAVSQHPHPHDGYDIDIGGRSTPLVAAADGTVIFSGPADGLGNAVTIKLGNGDLITYAHMQSFVDPATGREVHSIPSGTTVKQGQPIGMGGGTQYVPGSNSVLASPLPFHTHFIYGTATASQQRAAAFDKGASGRQPFNPGQLTSPFSGGAAYRQGQGYKTDPAPYFCTTHPIQDGNANLVPLLGSDTMAQYQALFQNTPPGGTAANGQYDNVSVEAANMIAMQARANGQTPADTLQPGSTFGAAPPPLMGDATSMSPSDSMKSMSEGRMSGWTANMAAVESEDRALWADYVRLEGTIIALNHAMYQKKKRIEALMATLVAQRMPAVRADVSEARERAMSTAAAGDVK